MTSRRSNLFLVLLIVLALCGVGLLAVPGSPYHRGVTKGLDLQGGLEVILRAQPPKGHPLQKSDLDRAVSIMRSRVDKLGVSEPIIREQSPDEIVIQLAGIHDPDQAAAIIGKTAQLELYDLTPALESPSIDVSGNNITVYTNLYKLLSAVQSRATTGGPPSGYVLFKPVKIKTPTVTGTGKKKKTVVKTSTVWVVATNGGPTSTLHRDPTTGNPGLLDTHGGKVPTGWKVLKVPPKTEVITCSAASTTVCPGDTNANGLPPAGKQDYYLFKHGSYPGDRYATDGQYPNMTGNELNLSGVRQDFDTTTGEPIVLLAFKGKGNAAFLQVTKNEAIRGETLGLTSSTSSNQCGAPCAFAIVLDNQIRSWPAISAHDNPGGIDPRGTGAEINGIGSLSEAKQLALVLQTGALPVKFVTVERTDVSATLGKDSLKQAQNAAIGGLIIVALFLLLLYRFLGLVAVIGLAIYASFMYAAILLFGVTLTLPGFAGLILTIGVAADANVVIFERIKEEARAGRSVRAAVSAGYAKGFRTIVDANVVTAITALILFAVASADVKGFALMLLIGTVVSLITAVAATRAMLGLLAGFRWFANPRFMGAHHSQRGAFLQIDFMRRMKLWFALSGIIIVLGAGSLATRGLNLGIDFKGGVQISFATTKPTNISSVRDAAKSVGHADAVVQGRGKSSNNGNDYNSFQVDLKKLNPNAQTNLENAFVNQANARTPSVKNVSSSFGRQIAKAAIIAILFSLLVITLYIAVRFKGISFAIPVIVAMIHDVIITVGVYSLTGREVTENTVAAVLTVLGYSIYDTIIIFDRIRENVPIMRRASFATLVNVSLWETIRRSLATTFITLLPVGALFFFGGATLKDFAFALLVGITSGAYSSIFIAAPMLTLWKQREPEYARRKGETTPEGSRSQPLLAEAEQAASEEPTPETPVDVAERVFGDGAGTGAVDDAAAKLERRRQRRKRPHGRAR
ncbi:MAG TPA: protein translocase subunit SecD [Gaiellaceae bacterium]|nr:protein translocase subunit SecD [Gaiellaceae bacterium]